MDHQIHPTNPEWVMFDPEVHKPPQGQELLILSEGNVLIKGQWYVGARAWCYKPKVPDSVKARFERKS